MIKWLLGALLSPLTALGEKYLDNQADKERLRAGTDQVVYNADAAVRSVKLKDALLRLPLFVSEFAASAYIAAILVDSTYPMEWLTPLELPEWFKPHFYIIAASIFGIAAVERRIGVKR
jgi:hypothetical protein